MGIVLGANQYGKAETRLVHVARAGEPHTLTDLNVSVALAGDLADVHLSGDNGHVLPTDTQKNTVYAFARQHGVASVEAFGLLLARHFVDSQEPIHAARVRLESYSWSRLGPHSFQRDGGEVRTATVTYDGSTATVVSGVTDLVLLNSTDSEFVGFIEDGYTTLAPTTDRILATAVTARWRHATADGDWDGSYAAVRSSWSRLSSERTAARCSRRSTPWGSGCSPRARRSSRCAWPCPTGTTSWWI
ncbi:factor-independent urate hydroxylase [Luedemannella flava]